MSTKTAYQFDAAGLLLGTTEADESPLEPGVFHLPARCTFVAPPDEVPDGQWPRWNGTSWALAKKPEQPTEDPVAKLQAFLAANHDVAAIIGASQGGV